MTLVHWIIVALVAYFVYRNRTAILAYLQPATPVVVPVAAGPAGTPVILPTPTVGSTVGNLIDNVSTEALSLAYAVRLKAEADEAALKAMMANVKAVGMSQVTAITQGVAAAPVLHPAATLVASATTPNAGTPIVPNV